MRLNHPGIWQIAGETLEVLAVVIGEAPYLRIISAIVMNDLVQKGIFREVKEESVEIQSIYANPDKFIAFEFDHSEVSTQLSENTNLRGSKMPEIKDSQFLAFVDRYIEDIKIPGRGSAATKYHIMKETNWTLAQAHLIVLKIGKYISQQKKL